jgi:hypothetical protein
MLAVTLTISTLVSIMFLFIGVILGWLAKEHVIKTTPHHPDTLNLHPEFFDEDGNVIPDQIFALRFENAEDYYDNNNDDEDD